MVLANSTVIELDMGKLEDLLKRIDAQDLRAEDYGTLHSVIESYVGLFFAVGDKNSTIARLRKMLFGMKTEKTAKVVGQRPAESAPAATSHTSPPQGIPPTDATRTADVETRTDSQATEPDRPKGHGRNGADAYTAAEKIEVPHPSLQPGDPCPQCVEGTLYETGRPGVVVRLVGQPPVGGKVYYLQKLRCALCGVVFTADLPAGVDAEGKRDATVGSMIALLKYGMGMPFNRNETFQQDVGVPLPAATQWDIVTAQAEHAEPVFDEMARQAAQGDVVYNDDTTVRILAMMGRQAPAASAPEAADAACPVAKPLSGNASEDDLADGTGSVPPSPAKEAAARKGMFTTGIVSETRHGNKIVLFLSGRQHAGENLADVLARRAAELGSPIQMCDALARNLPGELKTILANCLAHGRRKFVEVADRFPEECRRVLESLAAVYRNDAIAKERNMSAQERLIFHQAQSGPVMEELHAWLGRQFDERRVEPNSALGASIAYMLRHWEPLTLFLRVAGAPLDNNICERALKMAIRHRKNSLFYKTPRGAHVGDIFMSLIHTCRLCGANPLDYLTELERHAKQAAQNPGNWMPWNFRQTLAAAGSSATTP